jgi:mono/diheme cytochrome c family protein
MRWLLSFVFGIVVLLVVAIILIGSISMSASPPGKLEADVMSRLKYWRIGGKSWSSPVPDTPDAQREGAAHFQHHCQICHGLDGQGTGVPLVDHTSPPVADLASARVQGYRDGQLKWIIENGIRFTGMPGWKGILQDDEMWKMVQYLRHLPPKGSLGIPQVYREAEEEHHGAEHHEPSASEEANHEHRH